MGDISQYFNRREFRCRCGKHDCTGDKKISTKLVAMLETARAYANKLSAEYGGGSIPLVITSGLRCKAHNEAEGGKPDSAHLDGFAADIMAVSGRQRYFVIAGLHHAGFKRIGIAHGFIHVDIDPDKPMFVSWVY